MSKLTGLSDEELNDLQVGVSADETYWYALMLVNAGKRKQQRLEQHGFIGSKSQANSWLKTLKGQMLVFQNMKTMKEGIEQSYMKEFVDVSQVYNRLMQ